MIRGSCSAVRTLLSDNLDSGADIGAAVAVFVDGEPVVDIWVGYADEARTRPWERDTIANVFSSTKPVTAQVARHWPEFAAGGKADVEVRHLLGHTSGPPGWDEPMTVADVLDREKATDLLARQAPWWKPGTAGGYEPITFGPLVDDLYGARVDGRRIALWGRSGGSWVFNDLDARMTVAFVMNKLLAVVAGSTALATPDRGRTGVIVNILNGVALIAERGAR